MYVHSLLLQIGEFKMKKKITIVENATVITMNEHKEIIENGLVVFEKNKIVYVGTDVRTEEKLKRSGYKVEVIDGEEGILMPGMINCHTHGSMVPFRSLADDCKDRLKRYLFPLEQRLVDKELTYIGAKYAIAEMLLGGVTTFCDMYYFEDEVAKAAKELNMRGVLCETIVDFPSPDSEKAFGGIDYSIRFIEKWKNDDLITPGIAPHAPYTNTEESLKEAYKIHETMEVKDILEKRMTYVSSQRKEIIDLMKKANLTITEQHLKELIYGKEITQEDYKTMPLGKMKHDIFKKLRVY